MTKEYVQQYARLERTHWWFLIRQKIILQFLKEHLPLKAGENLSILNIGAAAGASSEWLSVFGKVVSVETEPLFIAFLKKTNVAVTEASVTNLPFADNSFDLVCAFDVIEHVGNDEQALKEMTRVCKNDAVLCLTVPACKSLWSRHDLVNGHFRRYNKQGWKTLSSNITHLTAIDTRYFNSILFIPIWAARKLSNIVRRNDDLQQSDFTYFKIPGIVNLLLKKIFSLELFFMKWFRFPFGVSLIAFLKKNNSEPQK